MLKFTERPKTPGISSKKTWISLKGISYLQVIFVLIWMKQTLIWFNVQRDGTGNGLSNIKNTLAESLQLKISVLHHSMCIFKVGLSSSYDGWAKYIYTVKITHKEHLLMWNSENTQNLNIIFITSKQKQLFS